MRLSFVVAVALCFAGPSWAAGDNAFVHTAQAEAAGGVAYPVEGSLTTGTYSKLVVRFRVGASWEEAELELQYGDLYRGQIPAGSVRSPKLEYYIEGVNDSGDRFSLLGSAAKPLKVKVRGGEAPAEGDNPYADKGGEKPDEAKPAVAKPEPPPPWQSAKCKKLRKAGKRLPKDCQEPVAEAPKPEPEPAKPADEPEASPKPKKPPEDKGRGSRETASAEPEPAPKPKKPEPEPAPKPKEPEADSRQAKPEDKKPPESRRAAAQAEPDQSEPKPTRPAPRRKSELDEDLAVYGAEATGAVVQHIEDSARRRPVVPAVLTAGDLKRLGVRYVHEALDLVPGLSVSRDVQGFWRVAVRGLRNDAEVLVQLNGQALNSFYDGKALFSLPVDTLERIEVYRGPATADLGLGNFLAVINLVTNRAEGLRLSGSAGLYDAYDGHLSAAKRFGPVSVFADGDFVTQSGYRRAVAADGLDASYTRVKATSDRRLLANAGAGVAYSNDALGTLSLSGRFMLERRSALVGEFDAVGSASLLSWQVLQGQLGWDKSLGPHQLAVQLWFDQQSTDRLWQLTPGGARVNLTDAATSFPDGVREQVAFGVRGFGLLAKGTFDLPFKNKLQATLNGQLQTLFAFESLSNMVPGTNHYAGSLQRPAGLLYPTENGTGGRGPAADRLGFGASLMDTWTLVDAVSIQAGVRGDFTQLPRTDATGAWAGAGFTPSIGPRVGLVVNPMSSLSLRASYGRAYRPPTVQEYADPVANTDGNQGRVVGNPQLVGAVIDSVELGFEYVQSVGDGRLVLRGQGFFDNLTHPIVAVDTSGNLFPYSNRPADVDAFGAEGEARLELSRRTQAWVNASWVRAQDLGTAATGRLLTDVPQVRLNAGVSFPLGPYLAFDVVVDFASERRNNSRTVLEQIRRYTLPAHTTVAAQLRTELLFDHLELVVTGQNVFNQEFSDDAIRPDRVTGGVPRETALVFGTVRVVF